MLVAELSALFALSALDQLSMLFVDHEVRLQPQWV